MVTGIAASAPGLAALRESSSAAKRTMGDGATRAAMRLHVPTWTPPRLRIGAPSLSSADRGGRVSPSTCRFRGPAAPSRRWTRSRRPRRAVLAASPTTRRARACKTPRCRPWRSASALRACFPLAAFPLAAWGPWRQQRRQPGGDTLVAPPLVASPLSLQRSHSPSPLCRTAVRFPLAALGCLWGPRQDLWLATAAPRVWCSSGARGGYRSRNLPDRYTRAGCV